MRRRTYEVLEGGIEGDRLLLGSARGAKACTGTAAEPRPCKLTRVLQSARRVALINQRNFGARVCSAVVGAVILQGVRGHSPDLQRRCSIERLRKLTRRYQGRRPGGERRQRREVGY